MQYGTHNSGTNGPLVWWQWIFTWIFQFFSKCQDRSIEEQLKLGVKVFNLQITWYKGDWHFSHGLCIYKEKFFDALDLMYKYATPKDPIYFQLFLDKNFFLGQNKDEFFDLSENLAQICSPQSDVIMLYSYVEGTKTYPYKSNIGIDLVEKYWTLDWSKVEGNAKSWKDKLPFLKRHAKLHNSEYKKANKKRKYLMLDFFEIG